jgi:high frequency lysogenization protein
MSYTDHDRVVALSGVFQAALCVRSIATKGSVDLDFMEPCVFSLFQTEAEDVDAVFGEPKALIPGARAFAGQLSGKGAQDLELTRYAISLLKLQRVLAGRKVMVSSIADGIEEARSKLDHFPMLHPNILAHLADIYSRTVSQLQPRIMVRGEPNYLQNPDNQNRIRALLLAGIRAAWLWNQVGGSRWKLLLGRKRLLETTNAYLRLQQH